MDSWALYRLNLHPIIIARGDGRLCNSVVLVKKQGLQSVL